MEKLLTCFKTGIGFLLLMAPFCQAGPDTIYRRLHLDQPAQFQYKETRQLKLFTSPWQGDGYMLASPGGVMIKLQLSPHRVIMAATPDELLYFDSRTGERRRLSLPSPYPQVQGVLLLRHLMQGDLDEVRRHYKMSVTQDGRQWQIRLLPLDPEATPFKKVTLQGQGKQRLLTLEEKDGDLSRTEFILDQQGPDLQYAIARLLREARGE